LEGGGLEGEEDSRGHLIFDLQTGMTRMYQTPTLEFPSRRARPAGLTDVCWGLQIDHGRYTTLV